MTVTNMPGHPKLRVAFYGRVARDDDGSAMTTMAEQYERCRHALPPGAITAVFYDVGTYPGFRRHPGRLRIGGQTVRREGGLDDLLAEAQRRSRRYDYLSACDPFRLSRDHRRLRDLLDRLDRAEVHPLFPDLGLPAVPPVDVVDLFVAVWPVLGSESWRKRTQRGGS
jgi:site-specific DNA recombinase